jgi:hypothetical protein
MDRATADSPKYAADLETDSDDDIQIFFFFFLKKKSINQVRMKEISHNIIFLEQHALYFL